MRPFLALAALTWLLAASPAAAQTPPPPPPAPEAAPVPSAEQPQQQQPPPQPAPPLPQPAAAPTPPALPAPAPSAANPTARTHDGLFARLQLGLGSTSLEIVGTSSSIDSGSGAISLAVGGAVTPNLIFYGELFGMTAGKVVRPAADAAEPAATIETTASLSGVGAGGAYCFMPANACLSGTVASTSLTFTGTYADGKKERETDSTVAFKGMLTKEWWLANQMALGLGGFFVVTGEMHATAPDTGTWRAKSFGLVVSTTYN